MNSKGTLERQVEAAEVRWLDGWKQGPTRLRWEVMPVQVGDQAPDLMLASSAEGNQVVLSTLWADGPALILFWRHYGCGCGMERAERLRNEYASYVDAGAKVTIIGQAEPARSAAYAEKYVLPCLVLCDPEHGAYDAYGLLEGKSSQVMFDATEDLLNCDYEAGVALAEKRRELGRPLVDNPWLLPAEFVVDRTGKITLAYRYQYCEDFPNPLVHIAAIKEAKSV
jgi:peroxiredoxin